MPDSQLKKTEKTEIGRLKKRSDFLRVGAYSKANKTSWVSPHVIFQISPNDGNRTSYGLTVSKRIEKTAVGRNRIKRRLRAALAEILPAECQAGFDIVVLGRSACLTAEYEAIKKDIRWCLKRLGIKQS